MLDALTLDQMRVFVAVAESGSFRAAAMRLSRVQSAVSHAIGNLEAQLQVSLFDRSRHRPTLTPEGKALLADAKAILVKVDAMRARARGLSDGVELVLGVAIDPVVPNGWAAAALRDLHARHPSVGIELEVAPMGMALEAVLTGRCALAITTADARDSEVEVETLQDLPPFVAVCAAGHPLARPACSGEGWTAAELADHVQIVVSDPSERTRSLSFGVLSPGIWRVGDLASKHALIVASVGWGNLPLWMVARDLAEGHLARVPAAALGPAAETATRGCLLRRADRPLGPAARVVREALLSRPAWPE